jgi:hypothetical protein
MAFSIEHLKGVIGSHGGLAKNNLFSVILPPIKGATISSSELNLLCKSAQLPAIQLQTNDSRIGSHNNKVVHGQSSDDIQMVFHVPNSMAVKEYFEAWISLAYNKATRRPGYFSDYAKSIQVKTLTLPKIDTTLEFENKIPDSIRNIAGMNTSFGLGPINGDLVSGSLSLDFGQYTSSITTYRNAYPYTVTAIELSNEQEGFMEISVSFTFSEFETTPGLANTLAGINPF